MFSSRLVQLLGIICLLVISTTLPAHAILKIDVTRGHFEPMPIALPDLKWRSAEEQIYAKDIIKVVAADLERSGLFKVIDSSAYLGSSPSHSFVPNFGNWRAINATALVTGKVTYETEEKINIEFRLWDNYAEQQIAGRSYNASDDSWRRVSHMIADEIYKRLTGEEGYFDTRVVYVAETGPAQKRVKRLAIMDQDGANHLFLTNGEDLVLTPRFSPETQQIIYLSYAGNKPRVRLRDIETGRERILGDFEGMTYAPRFSADGKHIILSASLEGNSEIYVMDLATMQKKRLTYNQAIDTSPSYSPDGKRIVFNSDRGGSQQLYVMDNNGRNIRRISFGGGNYGTPVWSPRGDWIAFTKMHQGKFHIGVMRIDGSGERLLTESYMDEGPTWAPNGRVVMFSRQSRPLDGKPSTSAVYSIDLTGYNERRMPTPVGASDPAWSPLLQSP